MTSLRAALEQESTKKSTENGGIAYEKTGSELVDLFFTIGAVRHDPKSILPLFDKAFTVDPLKTMAIVLWARDIRNGAGEREVFRTIIRERLKTIEDGLTRSNLIMLTERVTEVGRFDDFKAFVLDNNDSLKENDRITDIALSTWAMHIKHENALACKWAPREKSANNKLASILRRYLNMSPKQYRKHLAKHSNVVEQKMCARDWEEIEYSHVPSQAMRIYSNAFARQDELRFANYLTNVQKGDSKINAGAVHPHEIIKMSDQKTGQAMWDSLDYGGQVDILPVIDVSGSMYGLPMDVAVALGIYLSEKNSDELKNLTLSFSDHPRVTDLSGYKTVYKKADRIKNHDNVGYSTNVLATAELLVQLCKSKGCQPPKFLAFLTDMEFNSVAANDFNTVGETLKNLFIQNNLETPNLIWWNIQARNGVTAPVRFDENGTALISGFSPTIMKSFLKGECDPVTIMNNTVNKDCYKI